MVNSPLRVQGERNDRDGHQECRVTSLLNKLGSSGYSIPCAMADSELTVASTTSPRGARNTAGTSRAPRLYFV
jgi:hypothetical protein